MWRFSLVFRLLILSLFTNSEGYGRETVTLYIACEIDKGRSQVRSAQYNLSTHVWDAKPDNAAVVPAPSSQLVKDPIFPFIYSISRGEDSYAVSAIRIQEGTSRLEVVPSLDRSFISQSFPVLDSSSTHWLTTRESILQATLKHGNGASSSSPEISAGTKVDQPESLILSNDGKWIIWANSSRRKIVVQKLLTSGEANVVSQLEFDDANPPPCVVALHPSERQLYGIDAQGSRLYTCSFNPYIGSLIHMDSQELGKDLSRSRAERVTDAKMAIQPGGDLLYVSDVIHGGLIPLVRDSATGRIRQLPTCIQEAGAIHSFAFDASGRWLVAGFKERDEVRWFSILQGGAALEPSGPPLRIRSPSKLLLVEENHCCGN